MRCAYLDEFTTDAPPFVEFAGAQVMTRAMGGISPDMDPLDQAYDPTAAAELAAALEVFSIDSLVVPPRVRYMAEKGGLGMEGVDEGPLVENWYAPGHLLTVEQHVRRAVGEIRAIYAQARARGFGIDICWHPNP